MNEEITTPTAPTAPEERSRPPLATLVLGGLLVLIGAGWLLETLGVAEVPWGALLPVVLVVIGLALLIGARTGRHGGLVALGMVLTVLLAFSSSFNITLAGGVGERVVRLVTASDLRDEYRLAMGTMTLDLSGLAGRLPAGGSALEASVGMGELVVIVPAGVEVRANGEVGAGDLELLDKTWSGLGVEGTVETPGYRTGGSRLALQLSAGLGTVKVREG